MDTGRQACRVGSSWHREKEREGLALGGGGLAGHMDEGYGGEGGVRV